MKLVSGKKQWGLCEYISLKVLDCLDYQIKGISCTQNADLTSIPGVLPPLMYHYKSW
jgi:hypothetical protein